MSKAVLISIRPEWCRKIASGRKTMELRKSKPKLPTPFKCYIYLTKQKKHEDTWLAAVETQRCLYYGAGSIIGEFVCDHILGQCQMQNADLAEQQSLVKRERIFEYANGREVFGWHISELKIYDTPKKLSEFTPCCEFLDGDECPNYLRVGCPYQQIDYNQDASVNVVLCGRRLTRAPQSWCYVEELT